MENNPEAEPEQRRKGFSGSQVALIVLAVIVLTAIAAIAIARVYIFPAELSPVTLSQAEEVQLDSKLRRLGWDAESNEPEPYSELGADREVRLSEKEVNSLIGGNPDLAKRVAIDLSDNLASAKILVPIPEDFPFMPGQILRVHTGLEVRLNESRKPVVVLKGVSVMGVPIPNAWLGNLKNVDLVTEFGDSGFWKAFADGVDDLQVRDGGIYIKLRE